MKAKVWLSLMLISSLVACSCAPKSRAAVSEAEMEIPFEQDTLKLVPDFSYAITPQQPHIFIDQLGYRTQDAKIAYFEGDNLEDTFYVVQEDTGKVCYSGSLHAIKKTETGQLYTGDFSALSIPGVYMVTHPKTGDSYKVKIADSVYEEELEVLEAACKEYTYTNVSDLAYTLANLMFAEEMFETEETEEHFLKQKLALLMNSQEKSSGAFYSELSETPMTVSQNTLENVNPELSGTISLTATAQMAGVLAQYAVLYQEREPQLAAAYLNAAQAAYRYMEQYRANTDTDAWYYAAVCLYRATGQYKYRSAIAEYDAVDPSLYSLTYQDYTILADFTYLLTKWGADYIRCSNLLNKYMNRAQEISMSSSRENFFVLENMQDFSHSEILEDMLILGLVNHTLSGREYAGIQRNYVHYLSGVNEKAQDYLQEEIAGFSAQEGVNITNISKMLVIFGDMCHL